MAENGAMMRFMRRIPFVERDRVSGIEPVGSGPQDRQFGE